jgi:hypothetical protein
MKDKALRMALEALEYWDVHGKLHQPTEEAITAIKQALEQPVQEPVAYEYGDDVFWHDSPDINDYIRANGKALVYATPPAGEKK